MKDRIKIFTIGVFGGTEESFFAALQKAKIDVVVDIRALRGVRGSEYKYVNSTYLQNKLKKLNIGYLHAKEFSTPENVRLIQKKADAAAGTSIRRRTGLSDPFIAAYKKQVLDKHPTHELLDAVKAEFSTAKAICLLCVEADPQACHRSLLAEAITQQLGLAAKHLRPA